MAHDELAAPVPLRVTLAALALFACAWLPISPEVNTTLARVLMNAFRNDWLHGALLALVIGAPYLFGLAVALASRVRGGYTALLVRAWTTWLQFEVALIGLLALRIFVPDPDEVEVRAPWAIIGVAGVTVLAFVHRLASPNVLQLGFYARWGALLVVGVFAWLELQAFGHGPEVGAFWHGTLGAAFLLVAAVPRSR